MTTLDDWKALLADVDAATGLDQIIDQKVAILLGWERHQHGSNVLNLYWTCNGEKFSHIPNWSGSIDAVRSLIKSELPGVIIQINEASPVCNAVIRPRGIHLCLAERTDVECALALLSAFIRARIAELEQDRAA